MAGLNGKRVLITAGASGIGAETVQHFLAAGSRVHLCDVNAGALRSFLSRHSEVSGTIANVAEPTAVDVLFEDVWETLGGLDFLVNCAGIAGPTADVEHTDYAAFQTCMEVNLGGTFLCSKRAIPMLKSSGGGAIVNLSSTAGLYGYAGRSPYCSAKWAVIGLTKTLAAELGPHGIRCNAICPGAVEGDRMDRVIAAEANDTGESEESIRAKYVENSALKTFVKAGDIASMILFVCSDAGSKVSGQALSVCAHTVG